MKLGGRRYWPVKVGRIDADALARDRDQLFAEAVKLYRDGVPWWPNADFEREQIMPQQEARFDADCWEGPIKDFLSVRTKALVGQIARGALGFEENCRVGRRDQNRITAVLERMGWRRLPKDRQGNIYWGRPEQDLDTQ
jgi:predicted P-loop ATPase